jgi:hypothetical protein
MKPVLKVFSLSAMLIVALFCTTHSAKCQDASDYAVHANIIYRFTKYVKWPDEMKSGDFVIGFIGDTPLYDHLKVFVANKSAGSQRIVLKKLSVSDGLQNCHILFVSDEENSKLKRVVAKTASASTLIVTESEGSAKKGACINFIIAQERLKLEINKNNIEQRRLGIATELLSLGKIVK